MNVYLDITLLTDDVVGIHFLWEKVFHQLHFALVENKTSEGLSPFGVTFPEYHSEKHRLGKKLRIFARDKTLLEQLAIQHWFERLSDYVHITSVREVPEVVSGYVQFYPVRVKNGAERLARRAAKRQGISYEQALSEREALRHVITKLPYIRVVSQSNGQRFRLFIAKKEVEQQVASSSFSCYGLSREGGLPQF